MSFDDLLHIAYNSIEQPDGSWSYAKIKVSKNRPRKHKKLGLHILQRKRMVAYLTKEKMNG